MADFTLIHVVPSMNAISSGLDISAMRLAIEQLNRGLNIKVYPLKRPSKDLHGDFSILKERLIGFIEFIRLLKKDNSCIQFHGIWYILYLFLAFFCFLFKRKYYISPHGNLEPYALKIGEKKKSLYIKYLARYFFKLSSGCVVASSKEESSVKKIFTNQKTTLLSIGIEAPLEYIPPINNDLKYIIFIGRLSPEKGIDLLIHSLSLIKDQNLSLRIIGPESNYSYSLRSMVLELGLASRVTFLGELYGIEKYTALKYAQLLVLPSFTENFGLVVPEALSYGVPVLTTTGTPWVNLSLAQGCIIVEPELSELSSAIEGFLRIRKEDLAKIKISAKKTAAQYYWTEIDVLGYIK